jgi:cell division protein ZipA
LGIVFGILCVFAIVMVLGMRKRLRKRRKFRLRDRANQSLAPESHARDNNSQDIDLQQVSNSAKFKTVAEKVTGRCITVYLAAKQGSNFAGYELLQSLLANGLRFGDKKIFHRYFGAEKDSGVMFSLASATKPGVFELGAIGSFKSEVLVLFMAEGITCFDKESLQAMLDTAQELSNDFDAEIWGQNKQPLRSQDRAALFAMLDTHAEVVCD